MHKGKKVLIIDDSKTERLLIKQYIKHFEFEIFEAETALDGIQKAEEIIPDLILMDVVMPGMNGFQATKKLGAMETLKNVPVIMCTSKNQTTDRTWAEKQGAKAYIVKPVDEEILVESIQKILANS